MANKVLDMSPMIVSILSSDVFGLISEFGFTVSLLLVLLLPFLSHFRVIGLSNNINTISTTDLSLFNISTNIALTLLYYISFRYCIFVDSKSKIIHLLSTTFMYMDF